MEVYVGQLILKMDVHCETEVNNMDSNVYIENGYENRQDYLKCLAIDYGVSYETIFQFAEIMGSTEDFDGLIIMLEEMLGD